MGWLVKEMFEDSEYHQFYCDTSGTFFGPELGYPWSIAERCYGDPWTNCAAAAFGAWLGDDPRGLSDKKLEKKVSEFENSFYEWLGEETDEEIPEKMTDFAKEIESQKPTKKKAKMDMVWFSKCAWPQNSPTST